jgi:hypothetical protein
MSDNIVLMLEVWSDAVADSDTADWNMARALTESRAVADSDISDWNMVRALMESRAVADSETAGLNTLPATISVSLAVADSEIDAA